MTTATIEQLRSGPPHGRTVEQRDAALELANRIRLARAKRKRELARVPLPTGMVLAADFVERPPAELESMKAEQLVLSVRQIGRWRCDRLLARLQISPRKTLGGLTPRQRRELVAALRGRRI